MAQKHKLQRDPRTGIYFARIQIDGRRKRFALGKTRDAARSALRKIEKDIRSGNLSFDEAPAPTLSAVSGGRLLPLLQQRAIRAVTQQ